MTTLIVICVIGVLVPPTRSQDVAPLEYEIVDDVSASQLIGNVFEDANLRTLYDASVLDELRYVFLAEGEHQDYILLDERTGDLSTPTRNFTICSTQLCL